RDRLAVSATERGLCAEFPRYRRVGVHRASVHRCRSRRHVGAERPVFSSIDGNDPLAVTNISVGLNGAVAASKPAMTLRQSAFRVPLHSRADACLFIVRNTKLFGMRARRGN